MEKELKKTDNLSDVMAQLATDYNTMEMNPDSYSFNVPSNQQAVILP